MSAPTASARLEISVQGVVVQARYQVGLPPTSSNALKRTMTSGSWRGRVESDSRILVWPAVAVLAAGLIVAALAAAFYYHFGAWGAISMKGQPGSRIQSFVDSLHVGTEYITCLVRFGRVFFGLGQVMLAIGLFHGEILPLWLIGGAGILGLAAMVVTMAFPDNLEYYWPLFHLNTVWLAGIGIVVLTSGIMLRG